MSKVQLALVIDLNVCVGCHACVTSCKEWNTGGAAGPLADINPYGADPSGTFFNRVQTFEVGEYPYYAAAKRNEGGIDFAGMNAALLAAAPGTIISPWSR